MSEKGIKHFWVDTETLSFDQSQPDIIQLACLVEQGGKVIDKWASYMKPCIFDKVEPGIWEFHQKHLGKSKSDILNKFPDQNKVFDEFMDFLNKHCDPFDRTDKMIMGGYNVGFDRNKIIAWFDYNNYNNLFSYFAGRTLDVYHILSFLLDDLNLPSFKLENVWKYLVENGIVADIKGNNHSAITDITQTYMLYKKIVKPAKEAYLASL